MFGAETAHNCMPQAYISFHKPRDAVHTNDSDIYSVCRKTNSSIRQLNSLWLTTITVSNKTRRMAIANGTCISFRTFWPPLGIRSWNNRGKRYMDGKRIQQTSNL